MSHMRLSRRWLVGLLVACVVVAASTTAALSASGTGAVKKKAGKLVFVAPGGTFGAAFNAAFLVPFEKATGIEVVQVAGGDNPIAAVQAQVQSRNVQWDIVGCVGTTADANPTLWEPLNKARLKRPRDLINPRVVTNLYVASDIEAQPTLAYSKKAFPGAHPQTWADFFDVNRFPGPRGLSNIGLDSAWYVPAIALLADGVPANQLFPLDLDRAYAKLDKLKPNVRVFWTTFSQSQEIMRSGDVVMNVMTDGRALQLKNAGEPFDLSFQQAFQRLAGRCVIKGAPHKANAFKFLQYMLNNTRGQGVLSSLTYYGAITKRGNAAAAKLGIQDSASTRTDLIPDTAALRSYVLKNRDELLARWNKWVAS